MGTLVARQERDTYKPVRRDGKLVCKDCGVEVFSCYRPRGREARPPLRCCSCAQQRDVYLKLLSGRQMAALEVARARRHGLLTNPRLHECVDCGQPAHAYDHRDYNEPLNVEPVCRSCNALRGSAIPFNPLLVGLLLLGQLGTGALAA